MSRLFRRLESVEATLKRVKSLPETWRSHPDESVWTPDEKVGLDKLHLTGWKGNKTRQKCADELDEALGGSSTCIKGEDKE